MQNKLLKYAYKQFKACDTLQKVIANISWLLLDKIIRMGVGLVVGAWVARYLGAERFGVLSYATAFVAFFSVLATLGLDAVVVKNIVKNPSRKNSILGTAFLLKIIGGGVVLLLSIGTIAVLRRGDVLTKVLVGIIVSGTIFSAFDVIDFWFQSQVKSKYTVYAKSIAFLTISLAKVVLILTNAGLVAFALAGLFEIILGAAGLLIFYRLKGNSIAAWKYSKRIAVFLLKDSWPLIVSGAVIMIYLRIDQIMLGQMKGDDSVGLYSAAVKVAEMCYFLPSIIVSSIFPSIILYRKNDEQLYKKSLQHLFNLMVILSLLIVIPVSFFANEIIMLLFGEAYAASGLILAIQVWANVFVFLGIARGPWILAEGFMKFSFLATGSGAIINIILNLYLIPEYGGVGASIATVISYAVGGFLANSLWGKTRPVFIMQLKAILLLDFFSKCSILLRRNYNK